MIMFFMMILPVIFYSATAMAQVVSDDDEVVEVVETEVDTDEATPEKRLLRLGVLNVRATYDAERFVSESVRRSISQKILGEMEKVNTPSVVVPHSSLMKLMGPRERVKYDTCWIDRECLAIALKPANLDVIVASKLRVKEIDTTHFVDDKGRKIELDLTGEKSGFFEADKMDKGETPFAEYTLFIRILDIRGQRIMREVLVSHTDYSRLPELGERELHQALLALGFISDMPSDMGPDYRSDDGGDKPVPVIVQPEISADPTRKLGVKIAAWTTFGTGLLAGGLGLLFGQLSNSAQSDAEWATTPKEFEDSDAKRETYMITANAMYGTGGGLLLTSLILFAVGYYEDDDSGIAGSAGDAPPVPLTGVMVTPDGFFVNTQTRF